MVVLPAFGQTLTNEQQSKLVQFYQIMKELKPEHLFNYNVESHIELMVDGIRVEARQVHVCEVIHDKGSLNGRRDQIIGQTKDSDNLHLVLPDGRAMIVFRFNPCVWTDAAPEPGTAVEVVPVDRTSGENAALAGNTATTSGMVVLLDNAVNPERLAYFELTSLASLPGISELNMSLAATADVPSNTLVEDIPAMVNAAEALAATSRKSSDDVVSVPDPVVDIPTMIKAVKAVAAIGRKPSDDFVSVSELTARIDQAIMFHASLLDSPVDMQSNEHLQPFVSQEGWVLVAGSPLGPGADAEVTIDEKLQIDVDLSTDPNASQVGVMQSQIAKLLPLGPFKNNPKLQAWTIPVCIENDCVELQLRPASTLGVSTSVYTLFHPRTGRQVVLLVSVDDLAQVLLSRQL